MTRCALPTRKRGEHYKDQQTYSTQAVLTFLPAIWDREFVLSARPPRAASGGVKTKVDPRHIPDWLLACADVQRAWRSAALEVAERECLRFVHHLGYSPDELAETWGVQPSTIHGACDSGVAKLRDYLNGRVPK